MPWVDIIIVVIICIAAFIGYKVGLFGALKGYISHIAAMIISWILTPFAQAWLEGKLHVESFLAELIGERIPVPLEEFIRGLAATARTLQDFRAGLMSAPLPPEMAAYLQRMMQKAPEGTVPTPEMAVNLLSREIAQCVMWALIFIFIWLILSIVLKGIISMIFVGKNGKTIIGVLDGVLGMTAMTFIVVIVLLIMSGSIYPFILMSGFGKALMKIYPYLVGSRVVGWLASIYQLYFIPWIG